MCGTASDEQGQMSRDQSESRALTELKTRARLRLNAWKASQPELRLRDCLNAVSRDAGFDDFPHARRVLNGEARPGDDFGTFWYAPRCAGLLNQWFATYEEARAALEATPQRSFLLPYKRQFMVVEDDFIRALGLGPEDEGWAKIGFDAVPSLGVISWENTALGRMKVLKS